MTGLFPKTCNIFEKVNHNGQNVKTFFENLRKNGDVFLDQICPVDKKEDMMKRVCDFQKIMNNNSIDISVSANKSKGEANFTSNTNSLYFSTISLPNAQSIEPKTNKDGTNRTSRGFSALKSLSPTNIRGGLLNNLNPFAKKDKTPTTNGENSGTVPGENFEISATRINTEDDLATNTDNYTSNMPMNDKFAFLDDSKTKQGNVNVVMRNLKSVVGTKMANSIVKCHEEAKLYRKSTFTGLQKLLILKKIEFFSIIPNPICFMEVRHQNNTLYYRGGTLEGEFHGIGELYHPNGALKYKGKMRYGGPTGKACTLYHPNGLVCYLGEMIDGNIIGRGVMFDYAGFVESEGQYYNGQLHGIKCQQYYGNGELKYKGSFSYGEYRGEGTQYYSNGEIKFRGHYKNSLLDCTKGEEYHENGKQKYFGKYIEGNYDGKGELFHANGAVYYKGMFKKGGPHGDECVIYYNNGKVNYKGGMIGGEFDGDCKKFDKSGCIRYKGKYVKNQREGTENCRQFNSKGELVYEGGFKGGLYEGFGIQYEEDSYVLYRGNWKHGKYDGTFGELYYNKIDVVSSSNSKKSESQLKYKGGFLKGIYDKEGGQYWPNGNQKKTGQFQDGLLNGKLCKVFRENGNVLYEGAVQYGKPQNGTFYDEKKFVIKDPIELAKYKSFIDF